MRVFVTGGNGFIGSVVVGELIASGHDVVCLLRPTSQRDRLAGLPIEQVAGDVCDVESFRAAMSTCECTIHLAAPGGWSRDDPNELRRVIEGGARNVFAIARQLSGHRVVLVSSTAAVGASDVPQVFDERATFSLRSGALLYAYAKHRAEVLAWEACREDVPVVIVNPSEVYGPNDTALGTATNLIDFAKSWPVLVCRGGTGIVHVADVAERHHRGDGARPTRRALYLERREPNDSAARRARARAARTTGADRECTEPARAHGGASRRAAPYTGAVQYIRGIVCDPVLVRRQHEGRPRARRPLSQTPGRHSASTLTWLQAEGLV